MVEMPRRLCVFLKLLQMFLSLKMLGIFLKPSEQKDPSEIISRKEPSGANEQAAWGFFCRTKLPCAFIKELLAKILLQCF